MISRNSILTFVVAGVACVAPAAQAHSLAGDSGAQSVSAKSSLSVMQLAGIRYHAAANYKNERFIGKSAATGLRPDNRPGVRGI